MTYVPPVTDPEPIIDLATERIIFAHLAEIAEASAPETVEALPAVAIVAAGAKLETTLLSNPAWDNFWIAAGGRLNDVWHSLGSHLFGGGGGPSLDTVTQLIQLSMHVNMRSARQLITNLASHTAAIESRTYRAVVSVARDVNAVARSINPKIAAAENYAHGLVVGAIAALQHDIGVAENAAVTRAAQFTQAERAALMRDVINPLRTEVAKLQQLVVSHDGTVTSLNHVVHAQLIPELATALALAQAASKAANKVETFVDDCGEQMCETVGPKTNWGQLFKRFDAALLWALLAAIAAESPEQIEHAAEDFARLIGPPLDRWASSWLGLSNDDRAAATREVGGDVGSIPGIP